MAILHEAVLEPLLEIDDEAIARGTHVEYSHTDEEAVALVDEGKVQTAFPLNPTQVEEVLTIAELGASMLQKSTDFPQAPLGPCGWTLKSGSDRWKHLRTVGASSRITDPLSRTSDRAPDLTGTTSVR